MAKAGEGSAHGIRQSEVTLTDAASKASAKGKPFEVELLQEKGKTVWEFEVVTDDGRTLAVDVDADTGDVIDSEPKR